MHKTKIAASLMALVLITASLAGCGNTATPSSGNSTSDETAVEETAQTEQIDKTEDVKENGEEKPVYEVATVRWSDWGEDYHMGFPDAAAAEAGIEIQWNTILNADWGDRKAVLLAGGDLPDAFLGDICFSESDVLTNVGTFIALEEYIDEYMPNLKAIMESDPKMKALATSADGHIYGLPTKNPCGVTVYNQLFINKTWLDNLGLAVPTTWEEFENVLRAFKEQDANGNGDLNDEIPYGEGYADAVMYFCLPFGTTLGVDGTYSMAIKDGEPVYLPTSQAYKDGIAWMHKCYEDGLIDAEIFTQDDSMRDAKLMNETPIVGVAAGWTADSTFGPNADQYVALPALKGPDGECYIASDPDHANYARCQFMITSSCENPGKLLSWIDKFYTEDASIQNFYGSFGVGVEKDESTGMYTVLEPRDGMSADTYAWVYSLRSFGPKYGEDNFNEKIIFAAENGDASKIELDKTMKQYAKEAYPNVSYTIDQINTLSTLYTDIASYVSVNQAAWVTDGGIEEQWDGYLETLDQMGYQDFIKIQTDAYNTYKANE